MSKFVVGALFRTLSVENSSFVIEKENFQIEHFSDGREIEFVDSLAFARDFSLNRIDPAKYVPPTKKIRTDHIGTYILINYLLDDLSQESLNAANAHIDEVITILGLKYNDALLGELIYRNVLPSEGKFGFGGISPVFKPFKLDENNTFTDVQRRMHLPRNKNDQVGFAKSLMIATLAARSRVPETPEQAFLDVWMLLDVHPMGSKKNTNEKLYALREHLAKIARVDAEFLSQRLKLKHLQNVRGHLAHHGTFGPRYEASKFDDLKILVAIRDVVLREFYGFEYMNQFYPWIQ